MGEWTHILVVYVSLKNDHGLKYYKITIDKVIKLLLKGHQDKATKTYRLIPGFIQT